jgi:hypothetical protein
MNHSGAAGSARATNLRRSHWIALGAGALVLALIAGVLLYLSPVLALLDNNGSAPVRGAPGPAKPPPPLDSTQRINILLLGATTTRSSSRTPCSPRR